MRYQEFRTRLNEFSQVPAGTVMFHGSDNLNSIKQHGFKMMPIRHSRAYGEGIYLTPIADYAATYGDVVEVKVKVPLVKVTQKEYDDLMRDGDAFKALWDKMFDDDVEQRGFKAVKANPKDYSKEARAEVIRKHHIKGFLITDPSYSIGGQPTAVVFDPQDIEIVGK